MRSLCEWDAAVGWMGSRPLTPDCHPLVGATRAPGLWLNTGHSFSGWREAAFTARVLATALCGPVPGTPSKPAGGAATAEEIAAEAYSPTRFQPWGPRGT